MKAFEYYKDKQGRPYRSPLANPFGGIITPAGTVTLDSFNNLTLALIKYYGNIDGSDLGEPTSAMDYLDYALDGGTF